MRVILAGLFVYSSVLASIGLMESIFAKGHSVLLGSVVTITVMLSSFVLSMYVFNARGFRPNFPRKSHAERIADLESHGLLSRESFRALRCFHVGEFEDEGTHYYIELDDGRVLYLTGQYLWDYEPITDDPELNEPRTFPCSEFEILRHRKSHYVMDIVCKGSVLEPELILPPYVDADLRDMPEDGEIISSASYEEIKRGRQAAVQ